MTGSSIQIRANSISLVVLRVRKGAETLLLRRTGKALHGAWCQVAGKVEAGEAAWQAAVRELREETGLTPRAIYAAGTCEQFYSAAHDCIDIAPVFVAFVAADADVSIEGEHSAYQWVALADAAEHLATPNQREMFDFVKRHFVDRPPAEWCRVALG